MNIRPSFGNVRETLLESLEMTTSTTEGSYGECPVCGKKLCAIPSQPLSDATCPHCGSLRWLSRYELSGDVVRALADRGVDVRQDAEGQITTIRFSGPSTMIQSSINWLR